MSALTTSPRTTVTGTVGTSATVVLVANTQRNFLKIHNPAAAGGTSIAYTLDGFGTGTTAVPSGTNGNTIPNAAGTTPIVNGAGTTLYPGGAEICDVQVPQGAITMIGSGASSPYTIEWA
jgi:hypothetical protein